MPNPAGLIVLFLVVLVVVFAAAPFFMSFYSIGPTQIGLVRKRFGRRLPGNNPIAFLNEAGYQADLLIPGVRFKFKPLYTVTKHPWVQVPAGQIGVVIAQVGKPTPIGAKSGRYDSAFGNFTDLRLFVDKNGEKGVQRPVLSPGTLAPIHPVAFLVITKPQVFGVPVSDEYSRLARGRQLDFHAFGLEDWQLDVTRIAPKPTGAIASRLGGFQDVSEFELKPDVTDFQLMGLILGSKNDQHNNYQDFQKFLEAGGKIGLQHDPLLGCQGMCAAYPLGYRGDGTCRERGDPVPGGELHEVAPVHTDVSEGT